MNFNKIAPSFTGRSILLLSGLVLGILLLQVLLISWLRPRLGTWLLPGSAFLFAAGLSTWHTFFALHKRLAGKHWPQITGLIHSSEIRRRKYSRGNLVYYEVLVSYRYTVDGVEYTNRLKLNTRELEKSAQQLQASLPVGTLLEIHYHPQEPGISYAESEELMLPWEFYVFLLIGLAPLIALLAGL